MMNPLPYEYPITQDVYGKLFASVGRNESGLQAYFRSRAQRVSSSGLRKLFKNPRCQAGWNKNVLFGFS